MFFSMAVYTHKNNTTFQICKCINICVLNGQSTVVGAFVVIKVMLSQYSWETKTDLYYPEGRRHKGQLVRHELNPSQATGGGRRGETSPVPWKRMQSLSKQR